MKKRPKSKHLVHLQKKIAGLNESALQRFVVRARKAAGLRGTRKRAGDQQCRHPLPEPPVSQPEQSNGRVVVSVSFTTSESRKRAKLAGDIAISADIARQNSFRLGHPAVQEIKILVLHGILHLAGFDHERDNGQMARKEADLRRALRLPVALIERVERVHPADKSSELQRGTVRASRPRRTA